MRIDKAKIRLPDGAREDNKPAQRVSAYTESYKEEYYNIEVTKLIPFKNQSRKHFDEKSLEELHSVVKLFEPITLYI